MNYKGRILRLRENGYPIIHLFGNWYWGRIYSKNYKKFSLWWFYHFEPSPIDIGETPIKPVGEYRIQQRFAATLILC